MAPMETVDLAAESELVASAKAGDPQAFERLALRYRRELLAHCYRMLGSLQDAEDALQEAFLGAWRGLSGFDGRSSVRSWLYRVCTNACLRVIARRPRRVLSQEYGPARRETADLGQPVTEPVWLEPWPDELPIADPQADPTASYSHRESVELAFIAALQHLPGSRRAVLIMREVLGFSAHEVAELLDTTPVSVNSALQRARRTVEDRVPPTSQQAELAALGVDGQRELVASFVSAWERGDVTALVGLLAEDASFTMPPLPAWFDGRDDVARFLAEQVFATPWRLVPTRANGQLAFGCYQGDRLGAVNVVTLRGGRIAQLTGFLDPQVHRWFSLPVPPER
jgi:RNA polymerase sigma-70 factor (ECF subfamily)